MIDILPLSLIVGGVTALALIIVILVIKAKTKKDEAERKGDKHE